MSAAPTPLLGLPRQDYPPFTGVAPLTADGKGADLSKALFTTAFWLFLYNVTQRVIAGITIGGGLPANGDVLTWVAANDDYEPLPVSAAPGAATIDYHTLTANTTISASVSPAPANGLLIVFVTQNATGGWVTSWNASDFSIAPTSLVSLANKKSIVMFAADGAGKWAMCAPPVTGR